MSNVTPATSIHGKNYSQNKAQRAIKRPGKTSSVTGWFYTERPEVKFQKRRASCALLLCNQSPGYILGFTSPLQGRIYEHQKFIIKKLFSGNLEGTCMAYSSHFLHQFKVKKKSFWWNDHGNYSLNNCSRE